LMRLKCYGFCCQLSPPFLPSFRGRDPWKTFAC
jgi:hypothetical protein